MIFGVLGTPSEEDMGFIDNHRSVEYLKSLPHTPSTSLHMLYPTANPLAVDLLQKMLVFDPRKRIGVDDALAHEYLSHLYNPAMDQPTNGAINLAIDEEMGVDAIREKIWEEMLYHHLDDHLV